MQDFLKTYKYVQICANMCKYVQGKKILHFLILFYRRGQALRVVGSVVDSPPHKTKEKKKQRGAAVFAALMFQLQATS